MAPPASISARSAAVSAGSIFERAMCLGEAGGRAFDDGLVGALRHRREAEGLLANALQRRRSLEPLIGVGADGDDRRSGSSRDRRQGRGQGAGRRRPRPRLRQGTAPRPGRWRARSAAGRVGLRWSRPGARTFSARAARRAVTAAAPASTAAFTSARVCFRPARLDRGFEAPDQPGLARERGALGTDDRQAAGSCGRRARGAAKARREGTTTCPRRRRRGSPGSAAERLPTGRGAGQGPRWSAPRGRRRCRRPRLRAAACRDRAGGRDRPPAATGRSAHRGRRG